MRIVKKEKVDVKKFMEEMKANRTNRSYTSLEKRAPRTPEPPPEWATGACESYSKVSAPPYLYQPHNKQDSYRFYSSYSQMSQNSQPFMASQLASTFNQPYYPYGQQFYANPAPLCPNREPYYSYPPPNPNKSLRQQTQQIPASFISKADGTLTNQLTSIPKDMQNRAFHQQQQFALVDKSRKQSSQVQQQAFQAREDSEEKVPEVVKKGERKREPKLKEERCSNKQSSEIKKQLQEVIIQQKTQILAGKKQTQIIQAVIQDFNQRLEKCLGQVDIQAEAHKIKSYSAVFTNIPSQEHSSNLQRQISMWQKLEDDVLAKVRLSN